MVVQFNFSPPWRISGEVIQGLWLVKIASIQQYVPKEFEIVKILGNRTLCCLQMNHYNRPESIVQYKELIVNPALIEFNGRRGFWSSHIYVDHPLALAWGHEQLGLQKEMATFELSKDQFSVYQSDRILFNAEFSQHWLRWNMSFNHGVGFGILEGQVLYFNILRGKANNVGWCRITPFVPKDSPIGFLSTLKQTWIGLNHHHLDCLWNGSLVA